MKKKLAIIVVILVLITLSVLGYRNYFKSSADSTTYSGTKEPKSQFNRSWVAGSRT